MTKDEHRLQHCADHVPGQDRHPGHRHGLEAGDDALGHVDRDRDRGRRGDSRERHQQDAGNDVVEVVRAASAGAADARPPSSRRRRRRTAAGTRAAYRGRSRSGRGSVRRRRLRRDMVMLSRAWPGRGWTWCSSRASCGSWSRRGSSVAVCPVSARNTSSRSGVWTASVVTSTPSSRLSSDRTWATSPSYGTVTVSASVDGGGVAERGAATARSSGGEPQLEVPAGHLALQLRRRCPRDDPAAVEDRDPVSEVVGLVEVLGGEEDRHALGDLLADEVPQRPGGCAGRARWSARRGRSGAAGRSSSSRRRAGAASAGVRRGRAVGGVDEVEPLEQLVHPRAGLRSSAGARRSAISRRFSRPVNSESSAEYCPVMPICSRTRSASRTTSWPSTRTVPASGRISVEATLTIVVLPAPLGPSSATTDPAGASRSIPSSTGWSP